MRALLTGIVSFAATSAAGLLLIWLWLTGGVGHELQLRVPGTDRPAGLTGQAVPTKVEGKLETFDVQPVDLPGEWPGFRGANRDGVSSDLTELARSWPEGGPPVLWSIKVGEGHAGAAVLNGRVYVHDYDMTQRREVIRCLSLADGKDIWRYSYRVVIKRTHGVSRTIPAVTEKYLVALGPKCHVTCLDAKTGKLRWAIDLVREYGSRVPPWYGAQCPLIENDRAILAPGGERVDQPDPNGMNPKGEDVLMMAVDCETGKVVWKVPNANSWKMTHSSIMPMDLDDGTRTYVYCASGGVVGVSAEDGKLLWQTNDWKISIANVPSPVPVGDDKVFFCGGYNAGCAMLQIVKEDRDYKPRVLFRRPASFGSEQQTPVFYKSHLFYTRSDEQFGCLGTTGQVVWASGADRKFGHDGGPHLIADDLIFVMNDHGVLTLLRATPESYQQLAQAKVLPGHDSWGPMALAGGRLICRDTEHMVCLDVSKKR